MAELEKLQALMGQYMNAGISLPQLYQYYNQQFLHLQQLQQQQQQQQQQQPENTPQMEVKEEVKVEPLTEDQKETPMDLSVNNNKRKREEDEEECEEQDHEGRPVMHLERVRHKRQTLQDMARPLKHWLYQHRDNPYPTKAEKLSLAMSSHMTLTQVSNWFANARRRLKNTVRDPELSWESRIRMYNSCVEGNQELLSIDSEDSLGEEEPASVKENRVGGSGEVCPPSTLPASTPLTAPHTEQHTPDRGREAVHQEPIPSPTTVLPPGEVHGNYTGPATQTELLPNTSDSASDLITEEAGHPHKYKQCILQRYLTDSYQHSLQQMQTNQPRDSLASSRHRNPSGSLSSHDFEEVSTSFGGSPTRDHQFEEHDEYEEFSRQWPHIENRAEDDLYWKEISAALALTSLARSKIASPTRQVVGTE